MNQKIFLASLGGLALLGGVLGVFLASQKISPPLFATSPTTPLPDKEFFITALQQSTAEPNDQISGLLVNHHLLGAHLIAAAFHRVASNRATTVVLISPNHFNAGYKNILLSNQNWATPFGPVAAAATTVSQIAQATDAAIDNSPFAAEHGIQNILPFLKETLPRATLVAVMVKDKTSAAEIKKFVAALPADALIVGSFDFSHELPAATAEFHDQTALAAINNFDFTLLSRLDVDSRPGLEIFLTALHQRGTRFNLLAHTNSQRLTAVETNNTTSYLVGAFSSAASTEDKNITLLALGDMMLDRNIRRRARTAGEEYFFAPLTRLFSGQDITLANAEGSFSDLPPATDPHTMSFTFSPQFLPVLQHLGFTHFSLANNHSTNFGAAGIRQTKKLLTEKNIKYFGAANNDTDLSVVTEIRGQKIALVGYHQLFQPDPTAVLTEIARLRPEVTWLIVVPHWGTEYELNFTAAQQKLAHQFIEAGADLVLGGHPHVVEPLEIYQNKIIFYSLGNFIFDQTFSADTQTGLAAGLVLHPEKIAVTLLPFVSRNLQLQWPDPSDRAKLLTRLAADSLVPEAARDEIKTGHLILTK